MEGRRLKESEREDIYDIYERYMNHSMSPQNMK